jgi:hypothetical protein
VLIKEKIEELNYKREDDLFVIIDLIYRKEMYYKSDYQDRFGFTEISQQQFKELIPSSDGLNNALNFLIENGLLLRNDYYQIKAKSKSYRIPAEYLSKTVPVEITDHKINRRIQKQFEAIREVKLNSLKFAQSRYYKCFKIYLKGAQKAVLQRTVEEIQLLTSQLNLKYSVDDIMDIIECRDGGPKKRFDIIIHPKGKELHHIMHRFIVHSTRLNAINDGFLFFKRNKTNGRLDTNLTSLPSYLRKFIISKEPLVNIDIKNSQPFFLYATLKNETLIDEHELARFGKLVVEGRFYEFLQNELSERRQKIRTRDQIKNLVYRVMFSENDSFPFDKSFFHELFPTIMEHIKRVNRADNSSLAIALQKTEAKCVLDSVMPALREKGIVPYTIHDSFLCQDSEARIVQEVFNSLLVEEFGIAPSVHVTPLMEEDEEPVSFWDDDFR